MGPLKGLRVIELAGIGPGPYCAMLLADLGADVIRVDRLSATDLGVPVDRRFDVKGRNRRSVALDLKASAARDVVLRLVAQADVLIEGFRPGVAERLGLGPDACCERNPRLVYGRMTGFGQQGPLAQAAGHDLNYIALTGALHAIGPAQGQPLPPLNLVGDYGGGSMFLALGILSALFERHTSGQGQVVDAAMVDGASSLMSLFHGLQAAGQWSAQRGSNLLDGGAPFYSTYPTKDGQHVSLAPLEPKFFAELVRRLDLDPAYLTQQYDRRCWTRMRQDIAQRIAQRTRDEWSALLEGTDVCFAPVLSLQEAPAHAHARERQAFVEVDGFMQPSPAPRFGRSVPEVPTPAPEVGSILRQCCSNLVLRNKRSPRCVHKASRANISWRILIPLSRPLRRTFTSTLARRPRSSWYETARRVRSRFS